MKKITTLIVMLVLCAASLFAQAPEKFTYQAVVRNANNTLVANAQVGVRVNILQGTATGSAVYSETHMVSSNANGLVTLNIGAGSVLHGSFANIDWADGPYFLKTDIDPNGGNDYIITSTQQLLSVPYALYAKEAANSFSGDYNDLSNKPQIPTVPTNVSAFTNDAGYITNNDIPAIPTVPTNVSAFTNDAGYITGYTETDPQFNAWDKDYNDLINKPTIPTVPDSVSAFVNDAGYLTSFTEQQILSISNDTIFLTGGSFVKLPAGFDGDYNSLTNKPVIPTVPTSLSAFVNDMGYITAIPDSLGGISIESDPIFSAWDKDYNDLTNRPIIPMVPDSVSAFMNDAGYITANDLPAYQVLSISHDTIFLTNGGYVVLPAGFSGSWNDLTDKPQIPTVPTNVSTFTNDAGYITMDSIPEIPTVPTNLSAFTNDVGYITAIPDSLGGISIESDPIFSAWNKDYYDLINRPQIPTLPMSVSAFTNDAGYLTSYTETDPLFNAWDKDYNDLINKPTIPTVPDSVSAFVNDAGYLTSFVEQQVLSISNDTIFLTGGSFVKLPAGFDGNYNSLTNKPTFPTIPDSVSAFVNDAGYITNTDLPEIPTVPTNVSEFTNDAQYVSNAECADADLCSLASALAQLQAIVEEQQSRIEELESQVGNDFPCSHSLSIPEDFQFIATPNTFCGDRKGDGTVSISVNDTAVSHIAGYMMGGDALYRDITYTYDSLKSGTYTFTVFTSEGCASTFTIVVQTDTADSNAPFTVSRMRNNDRCEPLYGGSIMVSPQVENYVYQIISDTHETDGDTQRGLANVITPLMFNFLYQDTYRVLVESPKGCHFITNDVTVWDVTDVPDTHTISTDTVTDVVVPNGGLHIHNTNPTYTYTVNGVTLPGNNSTLSFTGLSEGDYTIHITSSGLCTFDQDFHVSAVPVDGQPCPGTPTVTDYEGNVYATVQIGNQCWMKENMRATKYADGTSITQATTSQSSITTPYYYNPGNPTNYGYLYNWPAAKGLHSDNQGICPDGWHVPSYGEWTELTQYVGSHSNYRCSSNYSTWIAKALAATTGWNTSTDTCVPGNTPSGNNATGFSALPAGNFSEYNNSYYGSGDIAYFWSSTEYDISYAYVFWMAYCYQHFGSDNGQNRSDGFSVRCLHNY